MSVRVVIVDDSKLVVDMISQVISNDREIEIVGVAYNGKEAIEVINKTKPDIITLDLHMPELNGLETTKYLMDKSPLPILIVTTESDSDTAMEALASGAIEIFKKPTMDVINDHAKMDEFNYKIKMLSKIKVIRHIHGFSKPLYVEDYITSRCKYKLLAIGASTGGPRTLQSILQMLPKNFPLPILLVQHISEGFVNDFVSWMDSQIELKVKLAEHFEYLKEGVVYVSPSGVHLESFNEKQICFNNDPPIHNQKPAVDKLFSSVSVKYSHQAIGVLLTGMGSDGAVGLKQMRDRGCTTIAQDESTSIIFSMPKEAIKLGGADYILPMQEIPKKILELIKNDCNR